MNIAKSWEEQETTTCWS